MALTKIPASLLNTSSGITLGDNEKALFGAGSDLQIYHDGTNSYVKENGDGALVLQSAGPAIVLEKTDGSNMVLANTDGAVTLYYAGSTKLATTSSGASVTGDLAVTGDLNITGNVNSASVTDLDVTDKTITLGAGQTEALSGGSGIVVDGSGASILWDETNDVFDFNNSINVTGTVTATDLLIDTDVIVTDSTNDRVGINKTSPATTLDVGGSIYFSSILRGTSDGSASSPTIQPGNDGDTGLYRPATNTIGFTTAGSEAMRIDSSGNVGIGTDNPVAKLQIEGSKYVLTDSGQSRGGIHLRPDSSSASGEYGGAISFSCGGSGSSAIAAVNEGGSDHDSNGLAFITHSSATGGADSVEAMRIDELGNVGIGTSSPSVKLEIQENTNSTDVKLRLRSFNSSSAGRSTYIAYDPDTRIMGFGEVGDELNIDQNGKVGIGTTSPSATLDINGTIALNGVQSYIPKAWVRFNEDAPTITASGNVSSITETATGSYIANFTTSLADTDYTTVASMRNTGSSNVLTVGARSFNTSSTGIQISGDGGLDASRTQNEILYSEEFNNGNWTKNSSSITANSQTAPDGTTTADTLTNTVSGNHRIYQSITTVAGQRYTTSVHVKKGNNALTSLSALTSGFSSLGGMQYNFDTDTVTGGTLGQNCTRELLSNGWVRLSFSFTATTTSSLVCWVRAGTGNGTASATVHLWGCQHEKGDFAPSTYKQTTSAAVNLDFEDISLVVIN